MDSITKYIPRKIKRFCRNKENISPSRTKKYKPNQGSRPFRSRQRRSTDEPHHIEKTPVEQMTPEPLAVTAQSAAGVVVPHINNSMIGGSIYTTVNFHGNSSKNESEVQTEHPGRRPPDFPAQHQKSSSEEDIKLQDTKQRNKSSLKKKNESIFEGIARPGKSVFLNHVYTKLCITEGDCRGVNDEHEMWFHH
ncbi:protein NLRC3-like isoform X1 [Arapaima gigas]